MGNINNDTNTSFIYRYINYFMEHKIKEIEGEIIDFNLGFANHLIRSGQAIVVSDENLKRLDEQKKQAQLEEQENQ